MSGNRVKSLLQSWEDFNFHGFSEELDGIAGDITERVDVSEASKARLLAEYSDWINNSETKTPSPALTHLISSFQTHIDEISQRSNKAEKGFLKLYSRIITDLKDPVPVLVEIRDSVMTRLSKFEDLEIEVAQLRETLKDYNAEISKSRSNDKKLADLKKKLEAYDRNIDATLQERIGEVTTQIAEESDAKVKEIKYENDMLLSRLAEWETKNRELQTKHDQVQSELFDLKRHREEKSDAMGSELDTLYNDLDSAQSRYSILEKDNEGLREEIRALKNGGEARKESEFGISLQEFELKTKEIQRLMSENGQLKKQISALEEYFEDKIRESNDDKMDLEAKVRDAKEELSRLSDYESIKNELDVFKVVEFGEKSKDKPLETLILAESKELQSKNSLLRLENEKLNSETKNLSSRVESLSFDYDRQGDLIRELERHVESLQSMPRSRGEAEGQSSTDILHEALNAGEVPEVDDFSSSSSKNDSSLLPIIKAQRERFRVRKEELEEQHSRQTQQLSLLQTEISDLRSDNVKLYEKIRFLQSAGGGSSGRASSDVESRYSSQYEHHINPFTSFNRRERTRQIEGLNIVEKIILSMVRFMMSNKTARLFVFIYSVMLHGLVCAVLMKMVYHDSDLRERAAEWHDKYSNHMNEVHQRSVG